MVWIETPTNPLLKVRRHPRDRRRRARRRRACSSSTTRSRARTCSSRSSSAPTSSCTRPRSTSAATPTSSAASSARATRDGASACASSRTRWAPCPAPLDCFLTLRGAEDARGAHGAPLRQRRAHRGAGSTESSAVIAGASTRASRATRATPSARRQMRRFGGMVSFRVHGGRAAADQALLADTGVWTLGESLGGVESLIEHPGAMTHASLAGSGFEVPDDLIRLSVGIEHADDLERDLDTHARRAPSALPRSRAEAVGRGARARRRAPRYRVCRSSRHVRRGRHGKLSSRPGARGLSSRGDTWVGAERFAPVEPAQRRFLQCAPGPVAQLVEQGTFNPQVEGSKPSRPIRPRVGATIGGAVRPAPPRGGATSLCRPRSSGPSATALTITPARLIMI